jgi:hypothetical protein
MDGVSADAKANDDPRIQSRRVGSGIIPGRTEWARTAGAAFWWCTDALLETPPVGLACAFCCRKKDFTSPLLVMAPVIDLRAKRWGLLSAHMQCLWHFNEVNRRRRHCMSVGGYEADKITNGSVVRGMERSRGVGAVLYSGGPFTSPLLSCE